MNSQEYWRKREEEALKNYIKDEKEYDNQIQRIYSDMLDNVQKEINAFYGKYADKENITIAEAKKRVSQMDIAEYERKAKRYVRDKDFSAKANEEMRLYNATMRINRLEMLKANIGLEMIKGHDELDKFMGGILKGRTEEELKRQAGILGKTITNNAKLAHAIPNASFHNATFSDRIWQYQDLMKADLSKLLQTGLIQGKNARVLAKELNKYWYGNDPRTNKGAVYCMERLMRTELARVQTEAQKQSFERNGFEEYEFIANSNCCDVCKALDGKHFKVIKMMPGENAAPMHPHCRCSTAAYEDSAEYDAWLDYLSKGGTTSEWEAKGKAEWQKQNLTNYTKSGKIGMGRMERKKNDSIVEPMPKKQLNRIVKNFNNKYGKIYIDDKTDAYLKSKKVEGITYGADTIILRKHTGRAAVFEELIHSTQYRKGENDGSYKSRLQCEIEAQKKLLKYQKAYKLTQAEIELTKYNLANYEKQLSELLKGGD